jgi:hypothetical protein
MAFIAEELTAVLNPQNSELSRKRLTRRGRKQYPKKSNLTFGYRREVKSCRAETLVDASALPVGFSSG